jgi:transposase-like protein
MSRTEKEQTEIPDPEVVPTARRRRFSSAEKLRILEAADACTESDEMGTLLRREGIYSSYLSRWRRARGELTALSPKKRGPKPPADKGSVEEVAKLRRENERLQARLAQAEAIIEVQKKLSQLLGLSPETNGNKEGD